MSQFSILLSEFITSKDIPVYPLTQYCSLDRSTMYKYIGGKRLPPRQELVEKIADYMRLSPSEREKLITAWNIENVGADTYYNRQNVRDFILNFPDISKISPVIAPPLSFGGTKTELPACDALTSLSEVNAAICRIILKEAEKEDGRLALLLQPDNDYLFHFLTGLGEADCSLSIEHILCLNNTVQLNRGSQSSNLLYLQKILPLYIRSMNYNVYYYYDSVDSHFSSFNGLPCLILTSEAAVACTSDFQSGILYSQSEIIRLLRNLFEEYKEKCSLLLQAFKSLTDELDAVQNSSHQPGETSYLLLAEPCLVPFITPELVEKYLYPDLPNRESFTAILPQFLASRREALLQKNCHILYTLDGVRQFLKSGRLYEIPQDICPPFLPEDRKKLLSGILNEAPGNYQLLKGSLEVLPANLHLITGPLYGYLMFTDRNNQIVYLLFQEPGLLSAFRDYIGTLGPDLLYSPEQSADLIRALLDETDH